MHAFISFCFIKQFYWFYGSNNPNLPRDDLPIVLWLQGGPGAGGTGYGNFGEFGPLNTTLQPREYTWLNKVNLLFIDNPVGAGYSYVDDISLLTTNVSQISADLLTIHMELAKQYSFMKQLPYWIFSESYGGKMTANFGVALYNAISNGDIVINFQGVVLGDSWISGIDYVNTWPDYLYALTLIDNNQYTELTKTADNCQNAINNNQWKEATNIWAQMEGQIDNYTNNADFYYVLQFDFSSQPLSFIDNDLKQKDRKIIDNLTETYGDFDILRYHHLEYIDKYLNFKNGHYYGEYGGGVNESQISYIMNHQVRDMLNNQSVVIPSNVTWGGQSGPVFSAQNIDFMKPVVDDVDTLLANGVDVNIWNGQLDLICCTLGTLEWLQTIQWKYQSEWYKSAKLGVKNPSKTDIAYFKKKYLNLGMYYMMKAGHMVPADNPIAALMGVCDVTGVPF